MNLTRALIPAALLLAAPTYALAQDGRPDRRAVVVNGQRVQLSTQPIRRRGQQPQVVVVNQQNDRRRNRRRGQRGPRAQQPELVVINQGNGRRGQRGPRARQPEVVVINQDNGRRGQRRPRARRPQPQQPTVVVINNRNDRVRRTPQRHQPRLNPIPGHVLRGTQRRLRGHWYSARKQLADLSAITHFDLTVHQIRSLVCEVRGSRNRVDALALLFRSADDRRGFYARTCDLVLPRDRYELEERIDRQRRRARRNARRARDRGPRHAYGRRW